MADNKPYLELDDARLVKSISFVVSPGVSKDGKSYLRAVRQVIDVTPDALLAQYGKTRRNVFSDNRNGIFGDSREDLMALAEALYAAADAYDPTNPDAGLSPAERAMAARIAELEAMMAAAAAAPAPAAPAPAPAAPAPATGAAAKNATQSALRAKLGR